MFQLATNNGQPVNQNENWKSQAFINIYLPSKNGGKRKLGSIGLKASKPAEAALIQALAEDPEGEKLADIFSRAEIDFQLADGDESTGFDV